MFWFINWMVTHAVLFVLYTPPRLFLILYYGAITICILYMLRVIYKTFKV